MTNVYHFILKGCRYLYIKLFGSALPPLRYEKDVDHVSEMIYDMLMNDKPCMVARWGSVELNAVVNYIGVSSKHHSAWKYIKGLEPQWWWNRLALQLMCQCAGFFPVDEEHVARFVRLCLDDARGIDLLGSWRQNESYVDPLYEGSPKVGLLTLEPFWSKKPWTRALAGKRVLVVHPFAEDIERQYKEHRTQLFNNPDVLPEFELLTLKAVQSIDGMCEFSDWFEALDWMKGQMDAIDYDIALIGCGGYGLPLAAHAKRTGHKAVHLGGALQLLFGIKGKRWEDPRYGADMFGREGVYQTLFNEYWIYPSMSTMPLNARQVEGGCYWGCK